MKLNWVQCLQQHQHRIMSRGLWDKLRMCSMPGTRPVMHPAVYVPSAHDISKAISISVVHQKPSPPYTLPPAECLLAQEVLWNSPMFAMRPTLYQAHRAFCSAHIAGHCSSINVLAASLLKACIKLLLKTVVVVLIVLIIFQSTALKYPCVHDLTPVFTVSLPHRVLMVMASTQHDASA